jgi:hypothetical protein
LDDVDLLVVWETHGVLAMGDEENEVKQVQGPALEQQEQQQEQSTEQKPSIKLGFVKLFCASGPAKLPRFDALKLAKVF